MALELLEGDEKEDQPDGGDRVLEQSDEDRRDRADDGTDVRDELHQAVKGTEEDPVVLPRGEDPDETEDLQADRGAAAHDQAEQDLPADVARDRVLDEQRIVVLWRAVPRGHDAAHEGADLVAVDEQIDRQDQDEHQVKAHGNDLREQVPGEGHDVARALEHVLLQGVQGARALLRDMDVDPVVVEELLDVVELMVGVADDVGNVVLEVADLRGDGAGQEHAD